MYVYIFIFILTCLLLNGGKYYFFFLSRQIPHLWGNFNYFHLAPHFEIACRKKDKITPYHYLRMSNIPFLHPYQIH